MKEVLRSADNYILGADTETTSLKWYNGAVVGHCCGVRIGSDWYGYYIPVRHARSMCGQEPENILFGVQEAEEELKEFYEDPKYKKIYFNVKFDVNMLRNHGIESVNNEDAMILMFLRNENERNHRLKDLSVRYIDPASKNEADEVKAYVKRYRIFKEPGSSYGNIPVSLLGPYGAKDACLTLALWYKYSNFIEGKADSIRADGLRRSIYTHERDYTATVANMERVGFPYDRGVGEDIAPSIQLAHDRLSEHLHELASRTFNPGSDADVRKVMKDQGFKSTVQAKTGDSWGRDELMETDSELGECIAAWRNLDHNLTTITEGLPKWVFDGRIYGTYNQIGARTGRASASEPNLQAVAKRMPRYTRVPAYAMQALKLAFGIRKAFKAPAGYSILCLDESQFELRLLDHYAKDPTMHQAFVEGRDVHSHVSSMLFGMEYEEFYKLYKEGDDDIGQKRDTSKHINFAVIYGAGLPRITKTMRGFGHKVTLNEVRNFYNRYMSLFPGVKRFIDTVQGTVRRRGYIFNHYGRHKRVPAQKAYVGVNYLIQGVTADMLKDAKMRAASLLEGEKTQLMMAVHDEIDFLLHDDEHYLIPQLKTIMEDFPWCDTPIVVDAQIGPSWGELKDVG